MVKDKIVYQRTHVVIKERSSSSEASALPDEITGTVTVIDNERRKCLRFIPFGLDDSINDDWAMVQGSHSVVSYKNNDKESISLSSNPLNKHRIYVDLNDLQSVRRNHMMQDIAQMIFTLKDGKVLPTFHFNLGGSRDLLRILLQYLPLQK